VKIYCIEKMDGTSEVPPGRNDNAPAPRLAALLHSAAECICAVEHSIPGSAVVSNVEIPRGEYGRHD